MIELFPGQFDPAVTELARKADELLCKWHLDRGYGEPPDPELVGEIVNLEVSGEINHKGAVHILRRYMVEAWYEKRGLPFGSLITLTHD